MRDRINKGIDNGYLKSFSIECIGCEEEVPKSVLAELIDLITMQDIHPDDGLSEITFSWFGERVG